jgi:hypothetical protein
MKTDQKDAGTVAMKPATHVNYAQQTERNAANRQNRSFRKSVQLQGK